MNVRGKPRKRAQKATKPTKKAALGARKRGSIQKSSHPAAAAAAKPPKKRGSTIKAARPNLERRVPAPGAPAQPGSAGDSARFPVVGIGTSAGGLEALQQFLKNVQPQNGCAYLIVQHLDPTHENMLAELLQRSTQMPVVRANDGMTVQPDHCYVIPPSMDMSLLRGRLHLLQQIGPRGSHLPIDFFFRSLAEDQQERSIGVILSGTGTDGTLGVRALKERAGAAFVQSPGSAKFDGMPRSVIDAGLADVVAPAEELPSRIMAYVAHTPYVGGNAAPIESTKSQSALEKVIVLLRAHTGNDFFLYKRSTIHRRIERRLGLHQIDGLAQYVRYLRENPREIEMLFKEVLIGVTNFFRDPTAWEHLRNEVMPKLIAQRSKGGTLRAWVPACSTGEEAYSLAITFREAMEEIKPAKHITLQIFATDLDRDAVEKARHGVYPDSIAADVSPERLRRFFIQEERGYRVGREIREMVVFAPQNIIMDPPFTKLDILACRNLLIYLSADLQKRLIPLFHYSLNPNGVLFLGSAETVGRFTNLFASLDGKTRLYRRLEHSAATNTSFEVPSATLSGVPQEDETDLERPSSPPAPPSNLERLADRVLVQRFSPLGILCNDKGDILYVSGRAGKYLEPAVGKANLNIFAMARDGLRYELSSAFAAATRESRVVTARGVTVGTNGGTQTVDVTVQQLAEPRELRGTIIVVIADVVAPPGTAGVAKSKRGKARRGAEQLQLAELELDLQRAHEEVQTTREEMQTSQEELKSTNEELQSANEELQSTNEELTTSKEEMQSLNEELQTVNHELQSKVDELSRSNNDMKNLLNSTDIATLFLDGELRVRRFTTPISKIIKLIPGDAGRPITDIASDLDYTDLPEDAREVLRTLVFKEKQSATRDGRSFTVRIMPYRTLENVIDGVVITFMDASAARAVEAKLRERANQLQELTESLPTLVWMCRPDGSCDYLSRRWLEYTGAAAAEHLGFGWLNHVHPEDRERVREESRAAMNHGSSFESEFRLRRADGAYRWFQARATAILDSEGQVSKWSGVCTDIHDLKRGEELRVPSVAPKAY